MRRIAFYSLVIFVLILHAGCGSAPIVPNLGISDPTNSTAEMITVSSPPGLVAEDTFPSDTAAPDASDKPTDNVLGGKDREVEGVVAASFEELFIKVREKREWLNSFETEACAYRLRNVSSQAVIYRISVAKPFVEIYYINEPKYDKIQFYWWTEANIEADLRDLESRYGTLCYEYGGIKYYIDNPTHVKDMDDNKEYEKWVNIQWVENDRFFDLRILASEFSEDMLKYCDIEKVPLNVN